MVAPIVEFREVHESREQINRVACAQTSLSQNLISGGASGAVSSLDAASCEVSSLDAVSRGVSPRGTTHDSDDSIAGIMMAAVKETQYNNRHLAGHDDQRKEKPRTVPRLSRIHI
mgnify:CR=1 FL=1